VGASAYAQTINMKVNVPFSFIVGGSTLPSGEYTIQQLTNSEALAIRAERGGKGKLLLANHCQSSKISDRAVAVFHRYGDRYFLAQLWMPGSNRGREMPKSRRETEVAADYPRENVVLLASIQ
jgi:hypothetical protein